MKILAFAGKKQSGKNTCSNFLHGYQLKANGVIDNFDIMSDGSLVVDTKALDNGEIVQAKMLLDVTRQDPEYVDWASSAYFSLIRNYSFSDTLKDICVGLFKLEKDQCYGTNEQKLMKVPHIMWSSMPATITKEKFELLNCKLKKKFKDTEIEEISVFCKSIGLTYVEDKNITAREFMQFFGTEVCRKIYSNIWIDRTITEIQNQQSNLAIISDCRFKNECKAIQDVSGKVIYLNRSKHEDSHESENDLLDYSSFDATINNQDMSISENCQELMNILEKWGWTSKNE